VNIIDYKFYVRDVGITDEDLQKVVDDVVRDIALSTRIFKKMFAFTIEPDIDRYDFKALLELYERYEPELDTLTIRDYTEEEIISIISNPLTDINTMDETYTYGVPLSTFLDVTNILDENGSSIFNYFQHLSGSVYRINYRTTKPINALCICTIVPNIESIDEDIEIEIKSAIIEGLKYYTDTTLNPQNVSPDINSYKKFVNAKADLQGKFPVYGKIFKRSFL